MCQQIPSEAVGAEESGGLPSGGVRAALRRPSSSMPTEKEGMGDPDGVMWVASAGRKCCSPGLNWVYNLILSS